MALNPKHKRVLYVQYTNPTAYPPLQHSSRILADSGWDVLFLGTHAQGSDSLRFPDNPRIRMLLMPYCPAGWLQKLHYLIYAFWVFWWALRWRPHWIYLSDPLGAPAALFAALLPGVRLLYHEHDSPPDRAQSAFMRWILLLRKRVANKAVIVVLPNAQRVQAFARATGIDSVKVLCVWNCPAQQEAVPSQRKLWDSEFWIHYHGNVSPQLLPLTVIDALARLPVNIKLRVIGYETVGTFGYLDSLKEKAIAVGVNGRIEILKAMPREVLLTWARKADMGIALFPKLTDNSNMQYMTGASNKPFDYLACGCPLLVTALPDWDQMFVQSGLALSCDAENPASIVCAIRWYYEHPDERGAMGKKGRHRVLEEWNYERQFSPVLTCLELNVGNKRAT